MNEDSSHRSSFHEEAVLFYRHWRWMATPLAVCLALTALYNQVARPVYMTQAVVSIETVSRRPGLRPVVDAPTVEAAMARHATLIESLNLIEGAVDSLNGEGVPAELSTGPIRTGMDVVTGIYQDLMGTGPGGDKQASIIAFRSRLRVVRTPPSPWITVQFSSYDAEAGVAALNRLLDRYLEDSKRFNEESLDADREILTQTLETQKEAVGGILGALSEQSQKTEGGNPAYRRPMIQRELGALQDQLAGILSRRLTLEAQLAPSSSGRSVVGTESARAQSLRVKLDGLQAELSAKQEVLGERHPEVVSLLSQIKSAEQSLEGEMLAQRARLEIELESLIRQQNALRIALDRGINKASDVAVSSFDAAVLMREADAGERALTEAIERSQRGTDAPLFEPRTVQRAARNPDPAFPRSALNYQRALIVGLIIGFILSRVRAGVDETLRTIDSVRQLGLGLPLLGVVPIDKRVESEGLTGLLGHSIPIAEAYRVIRANLPVDVSVFAVTSARPGDGKSTSSAALALLLAETGERVLLIDGDLRRPSLDGVLGVQAERGFGDALRDGTLDGYVVSIGGIDFLPAGKADPAAASRLARAGLAKLLKAARAEYRFVVIDTPPALALADALTIGREADGTLIVVAAGRTHRGAVIATVEQLQGQSIRVLGIVLNQIDFGDISDRYGRYYATYEKYYTGRTTKERKGQTTVQPEVIRPSASELPVAAGATDASPDRPTTKP